MNQLQRQDFSTALNELTAIASRQEVGRAVSIVSGRLPEEGALLLEFFVRAKREGALGFALDRVEREGASSFDDQKVESLSIQLGLGSFLDPPGSSRCSGSWFLGG